MPSKVPWDVRYHSNIQGRLVNQICPAQPVYICGTTVTVTPQCLQASEPVMHVLTLSLSYARSRVSVDSMKFHLLSWAFVPVIFIWLVIFCRELLEQKPQSAQSISLTRASLRRRRRRRRRRRKSKSHDRLIAEKVLIHSTKNLIYPTNLTRDIAQDQSCLTMENDVLFK